jgi:hypothetical protein
MWTAVEGQHPFGLPGAFSLFLACFACRRELLSDAGESIRSVAPICPASHEGVCVKLFHASISRVRLPRVSSSKAELSSSQGASCKPHIRRDCVPTTVPRSGRESSRRAAPLCVDGALAPGRTTVTPPWIRAPEPACGSGPTLRAGQDAGFMTAPSGTTPWVANRHKAISSFRARATTITLRMRRPVPPTRSRNQVAWAEPG